MSTSTREVEIYRVSDASTATARDLVAVEEPLSVQLAYACEGRWMHHAAGITMRTPGHDVELVLGMLHAEGILQTFDEVDAMRHTRSADAQGYPDQMTVRLKRGVAVDVERLARSSYTTSSCGVCGKTSRDALSIGPRAPLLADETVVEAAAIHGLQAQLAQAQIVFNQTGGLHAVALFDAAGTLLAVREDVGRHNAMDKVVGWALLEGRLPLTDRIVLLSGRASYELVQKAILAGVPVLAAVGAPSSAAVDLARTYGVTLLGFVREGRFNVYATPARLLHEAVRAARATS